MSLDGPKLDAASGATDSLVIFCHGYGADGADLLGLAPHWQKILPNTAFISPNAPQPCDMGGAGFQWFPIDRDRSDRKKLRTKVEAASALLSKFIDDQLARTNLDESRLALVGFSQGTMMSLYVGLRRKRALAAIVGFSGALVGEETLNEIQLRAPILLIHGDSDPMIAPTATIDAATALTKAGFSCAHHISQGCGHSIAPDGLELAGRFLHANLKS